ncbi:MAG: peptide chain release factor 1 [Dehalococcoidia bacterium]|nr:peptide chain release factor 1 [Dehalococcoidia bacterium]
MFEKLERQEQRLAEIDALLADPALASDLARLQQLARERSALEGPLTLFRRYRKVEADIASAEALLQAERDEEMQGLAREELERLRLEWERLTKELQRALLPQDPNDRKDVIVEVRAGTGGEEAALFAAELFRMYARHAERLGWHTEVLSTSESERGGFKEIIFEVRGKGAFSRLKFERGVHRVQRVPLTEAQGRIHTSTATVAVLPAVEEVDVQIDPGALRIDIYHSGGAGGQNVNKVATAVRITHLPTGLVVACQDERSQLKNKQKAMAVLRARLYDMKAREQEQQQAQSRRAQVGTAERSEKVRTYNFPQDRLTDHRIGLTLHNLPAILNGELDTLLDALAASAQAEQLATVSS